MFIHHSMRWDQAKEALVRESFTFDTSVLL